MNKTTALHVHHTFCYIYKSSAPDSDKDVNFLTRRSIRRKWTLDDEFSFLYFNFYENQLQENSPTFDKLWEAKVWVNINTLFTLIVVVASAL